MKKTECLDTKRTTTPPNRQRQNKILAYLKKSPKVEKEVLYTTESNVTNESTCRKRRITESTESSAIQYKTPKNNDTDDLCIVECIQKHKRIPVTSIENDTDIIDSNYKIASTSIKKNILTECAFKENINIDKPKNVLSNLNETITKVQIPESPSNNVLHEKFSIEKCKPNFIGKLDKLNDSPTIKLEGEIKDSDTESLGCSISFENEWFVEEQLNFNSLQRCKVVDIKHERDALLLTVTNSGFQTSSIIKCLEYWKYTKIEKNSIIAVEARREGDWWIVDNKSGFVVAYPDMLISSTMIVGAIFCKRRSILNEKFRKIESLPCFESIDQTAMVIGSLTHQLLQKAIREDINKYSDIKKLLDSMLQSSDVINLLYAAGITLDVCKKQMLIFIPKIYQFIQHYLKNKQQEEINRIKNNFKGQIVDVLDIEENIWLPSLGIKGKIDVTVEVEVNCKRKKMPLEIKTGKPSFSLEHKGQIILYIMMMALTGQDTDTGLLLYLRENSMHEIKSDHRERRDLMQLRNVLAYYLTPKSTETFSKSISDLNWAGFDLPEPINHPSACSKCPYNALCCAYLSKDNNNKLPCDHPLNQLKEKILEALSPSHINYVLHWILLLEMEDNVQATDKSHLNLWTLSAEQREKKKMCISNLKMLEAINERDCKYKYIFVRNNSKKQDLERNISYTEFSENEYVLLSTNKRINVSAGFIVHLSNTSVAVMVDRDISKYITNELVHIDKYQSSTLHCSNLANVGGLLVNNEICAKLRKIVIDRKPATFDQGVPRSIMSKSSKIMQTLNENQQRAVLKALIAKDYILIKGMPGTGKTQTLIAFIELLYETGRSVLITSHTNNAVDNILLKLLAKGIDFLRLGSFVHESLKAYSEKNATASCTTPEELEVAYSKRIIGVTCYGAYHPILCSRIFDVCVVDESAQTLQPTVLRPLYSAHKFVLVGDPDQLPPIIKNSQARQLGADESLFSRLDSKNNTVNLTEQYRMNRHIMTLANKLTYNDKLKAGNMLIENATFTANCNEILTKAEPWVHRALSQNLSDSVMLLNTGSVDKLKVNYKFSDKYPESDQMCSNIFEAAVLSKLVQTLLQMCVKPENIGIIAPYRAHVNLLKNVIQSGIEINTVDQYQGRDKEIILYSCAKSLISSNNVKQDLEILGDHRRLTVAITRAKCKLIIVGDKHTLLQYSVFQKLFHLIEDKNTIHLHDNNDGFSWKEIISAL